MTAIAHGTPAGAESADHSEDHDHHPTETFYWKIALILAVLTAVEVTTFWWKDWFDIAPEHAGKITAPVLIILMVIKFTMIAAFFMHLRFDQKMLRRVFTFGIIVAVLVYVGGLTAMNWWWNSGVDHFPDPPMTRPLPPPPTEKPVIPTGEGGH